MIINFDSFGLYNPTIISFWKNGLDKKSTISFTQCNVEIIAGTIKSILTTLDINKAFYTTSRKLLNSIKQRPLANTKSLYELFCEYGIKIEESDNE